jgi:hypothetical protein
MVGLYTNLDSGLRRCTDGPRPKAQKSALFRRLGLAYIYYTVMIDLFPCLFPICRSRTASGVGVCSDSEIVR